MTNPSPNITPFDQIVILPYQSNWLAEYRALVEALRQIVPTESLFHHIGSTAVPGLGAKDIIDIQVTVTSLEYLDADALTTLGYIELPGLADHSPPGRELPPSELVKRFFRGTQRPAHVHVRVAGRFNQRYPLLSRDYLRAHPVTAAAYEVIKRHLSAWSPQDMDRYYEVKTRCSTSSWMVRRHGLCLPVGKSRQENEQPKFHNY
jgi:GrpB-like predicted nucleotidyltransferase (UPF0157 family)